MPLKVDLVARSAEVSHRDAKVHPGRFSSEYFQMVVESDRSKVVNCSFYPAVVLNLMLLTQSKLISLYVPIRFGQ
jgi:hypothetical protein